jgi:hypothetical protein
MNPPAESQKPAKAGSPKVFILSETSALQAAFRNEPKIHLPAAGVEDEFPQIALLPINLKILKHI